VSRWLLACALGVGVALAVSACAGSNAKLIPVADSEPLQSDFEAVAQAAEEGDGDCSTTEAALLKTEQDFGRLPSSVDAGLRARLREGIAKLRQDALGVCAKTQSSTKTTSTAKTTTSKSTPTKTQSTPTTSTETQTTSTEAQTTSTPTTTSPGGGTQVPEEGAAGNGEQGAGGGTGAGEPGAAGGAGSPEGGAAAPGAPGSAPGSGAGQSLRHGHRGRGHGPWLLYWLTRYLESRR
jgi:hypothetical protein